MIIRISVHTLAFVALAFLTLPASAQLVSPQTTRVVLFEGSPSSASALEGGSVIILGSLAPTSEKKGQTQGDAFLLAIAKRLQATLGLSSLELKQDKTLDLQVGKAHDLSATAVAPRLEVALTLEGQDPALSTYRIRVTDARRELANTLVSVPGREPGVVGVALPLGSRSLFLVLRRAPASSGSEISPPVRIAGKGPRYTERARKAKLQGLVVLLAHIDKSGKVTGVRILKSLPLGLGEAAAKAVSAWTFKPAHTADGTPVEVDYRINIAFRLS